MNTMLLFATTVLALIFLSGSATTFTFAQTVGTSTSSVKLLIDGTKLTDNVCYSTSSNLRSNTISLSAQPQSTLSLISLGSGPKITVSCVDLVEKMANTLNPDQLCSAKSSIQLCSGPLGAPTLEHSRCTELSSFYTAPKTTINAGDINGEDREWSLKYDGRSYSDFCFPRNVQVIVFAATSSPGKGSIAVLVIAIILVVLVLAMGSWYFFYQQNKMRARAEWDAGVTVMPNAQPDGNAEIDDPDLIDEANQQQQQQQGAEELDDDGTPRPPIMIGPSDEDGGNNNYYNNRGLGEFNQHSPRDFVVNDGPQIFAMGPIASIYGTDIRDDALSIGRSQQGRGLPDSTYGGGGGASGRGGSKFRVLPNVSTQPIRETQPQQRAQQQQQQNPLEEAMTQQQQPQQPPQQQRQQQSTASAAQQQPVNACPDCGLDRNSSECPDRCDVTGQSHF